MANWAYVENNNIKEIHETLPKSWKNVSGLNLSENNLDFLREIGWYKIVKQHDTFDTINYFANSFKYKIENNKVIEEYNLVEKEHQDNSFNNYKNIFMNDLRSKRDLLLFQSDWTQLADIQKKFDDVTKEKWETYRQNLRDLPQVYQSDTILNITDVNWPSID
jgi:hypothetical protein